MKLFQPSEYQPAAEAAFSTIAEEILKLLPGARLEHVGASAIPGALSKGDIDICVIVPPEEHAQAVAILASHGYCPKAGTLRTPELCMLESPRKDRDIALQVIAGGSEFEFFLHFRDALLANPALVAEYNALKLEYKDAGMDEYRRQKSLFIQRVLGIEAPGSSA